MNHRETILFEHHPQPMWIFDTERINILEVNEAALNKYGYSRDEFLSLNIKELHPASEARNLVDEFGKNIRGYDDIGIWLHKKKDGSLFYTHIISQSMEYNDKQVKLVLSQDVPEDISNEKLLKTSYNHLKYHVANTPLAIIEWDKNLKIQTWTGQAESIFCYPRGEIKGKDPFMLTDQYVSLDERVMAKDKVRELVDEDITSNYFELKVRDGRDNEKYTRWHNSALKNADNELISIISFVEDITSQRLAEKELHKSQQLYKSLFDNSQDAIILADDHMRLIDVNNATCRLLGYSFDELYMKSIDFITPEEFLDNEHHTWNDFMDRGTQDGEYKVKHKSGDIFTIEYRAVSDIMPGIHLSVLRDITKRKKAELELKHQNIFIETAINSLPGLFYVVDAKGNLVRWNKNMEEILGYTAEELSKVDPMSLYAPEDRVKAEQKIGEIIEKGYAMAELNLMSKDGTTKPYYITGKYFNDLGRNFIVGMSIDISQRKEAEEKIKKSLREKDVLLSEIHHRVKNNLAVISGLLELQKEITDEPNAKDALHDSQMRVHSIAMIHEKLYQNDDLSEIKFDDYIKDLARLIRSSYHSKNKEISVTYDTEPLSLSVNKAIPCGLIINEILNNAFEHAFTHREKGNIKITFKQTEEKKYLLKIKDDGVGLPDDISIQSTSLGQTLIRTLVRQLKANIKITSTNGVSYSLLFN
ncbi:MAG TPA: PAS domain S-box protein [Balneolales bacterium]|nr:PAS domain S-box protein [Balneolales bacterium]